MEEKDIPCAIRVLLIGKKGCGKRALLDTLVGFRNRRGVMCPGESEDTVQEGTGKLPSGQQVRVVIMPAMLDNLTKDVSRELTQSISLLSPGPHAFIIVLSPNRFTEEERRFITKVKAFCGDKMFLNHTMIVMVRKNEMRDENDDEIDIHKFIDKCTPVDVKELYELCGRRIVAVENLSSLHEKQKYAEEVAREVLKMDGYIPNEYFNLLQQQKISQDQIAQFEKALNEKAKESNRKFCSIM